MLTLRGAPALSDFRLEKLRNDLNAAGVAVRAITTAFIHVGDLVEGAGELTPAEFSVLQKLLTYGPKRVAHEPHGLLQVVAPRPGTISPWSSKATDIAHICGLAKIARIERAVAYWIEFDESNVGRQLAGVPSGASKLAADVSIRSSAQIATLGSKLHDRMTQVVFNSTDELATLF